MGINVKCQNVHVGHKIKKLINYLHSNGLANGSYSEPS